MPTVVEGALRGIQDAIGELEVPRESFVEFMENHYILPSGAPYSFVGHEYLREIAQDVDKIIRGEYGGGLENNRRIVRHLVIMKSAQCGISELAIGLEFYLNIYMGLSVGHYMPTAGEADDYVKTRIDIVLENSPDIKRYIVATKERGQKSNTDNVRVKMLRAPIYYRGAQKYPQSVVHDITTKDEKDRMNEAVADQIDRRKGHSIFNMDVEISTPTYPEHGIHASFLKGSQAYWHVVCPSCGYDQIPNDDENLFKNPATGEVLTICKKCGGRLNCCDGHYEHTYPDRPIRSYHINKLMCVRTDLYEQYEKYEAYVEHRLPPLLLMEYFNSDRGEPNEPEGQKLNAGVLRICAEGSAFSNDDQVRGGFLGIDIGARHNVCHWIQPKTDDPRPRLYRRTFATGDELIEYMQSVRFDIAVIDEKPELDLVRRVQEAFPGRVFRCRYMEEQTRVTVIDKPSEREGFPLVKVHRNGIMDRINFAFRKGLYKLPADAENVEGWFRQLCAPIRTTEARGKSGHERSGLIKVDWIDKGKADHDYHALCYAHVAAEIGGVGEIDIDLGTDYTEEEINRVAQDEYKRIGRVAITSDKSKEINRDSFSDEERERIDTLPERYLQYIKKKYGGELEPPNEEMCEELNANEDEISWAIEYIKDGLYAEDKRVSLLGMEQKINNNPLDYS